MNWQTPKTSNPVEHFASLFPSVKAAAEAAGVSTEMLRRFRHAGFVTTRDRAIHMAMATHHTITAAELLGVAVNAEKKEAA